MRIVFFSDIHIRGNDICSETDIGSTTKWIPQRTSEVFNSLKSDYVFSLGDLTASGRNDDWKGYKKWVKEINAPVYDIFGNHDRDHTIFSAKESNYGEGYFKVLSRISDTKVVKIGDLVFVLISEEHNPECGGNNLTSAIPDKKLKYLEEVLKKYSQDNNVFVLNHCLLRGTTAFSNNWSFNDKGYWKVVTKKLFKIFRKYPVVAHISGHTHMDYRYRCVLKETRKQRIKGKVGKFVDGKADDDLPNIYFLNMPAVDTAHGWVGSTFGFFQEVGKKFTSSYKSRIVKLYERFEEKGPSLFDYFYKTGLGNIWGRSAVYYFDIFPGEKEVVLKTRWIAKNRDVESFKVKLNKAFELKTNGVLVLESALSLRRKKNLFICGNDWFKIPASEVGWGEFSQRFSGSRTIRGVRMEVRNLRKYKAKWKFKRNIDDEWSESWESNPLRMGTVKVVLLRIKFESSGLAAAKISDIGLI